MVEIIKRYGGDTKIIEEYNNKIREDRTKCIEACALCLLCSTIVCGVPSTLGFVIYTLCS